MCACAAFAPLQSSAKPAPNTVAVHSAQLPAGEQEAQLLVRGNGLAGQLNLDQGPAAVAEKQAFMQLKAVRRLLRADARSALQT